MTLEEKLYQTATDFIRQRYPTGWGGAAVMHTEDGRLLISVAPETLNASAELCIETGAICEAHKLGVAVTHAICVMREDESSEFRVLTPCGICQERLRYWGEEVRVGVTTPDGHLQYVPLGELMPYYWGRAYRTETEDGERRG